MNRSNGEPKQKKSKNHSKVEMEIDKPRFQKMMIDSIAERKGNRWPKIEQKGRPRLSRGLPAIG